MSDYKIIVEGATEILPNVYAHNGGKVKLSLNTLAGVWHVDWRPALAEFEVTSGYAVAVRCIVNHEVALDISIVPTPTQEQDALGCVLARFAAANCTSPEALACIPFATTLELTALIAASAFAMRPGVGLAQETFDAIVNTIEARAGYVWKEVEA